MLPLRMEDLDSPRKKGWAQDQALADLRWLGIDWDGDVLVQTHRRTAHVEALDALIEAGQVYPCACSRRDVEVAQVAPHAEDEMQYSGACRDRFASAEEAHALASRPVAWRYRVQPGVVPFDDAVRGHVDGNPQEVGGDFVVGRWAPETGHQPGYQLAVVVDDAAQGVDVVIRGDDLLSSTPRQVLLQRALGLPALDYVHLPLVVGADGRRLAKRHGDTRILAYREAGLAAGRIKAWAAAVSGLDADVFDDPVGAAFTWDQVLRTPVVVPSHAAEDGPGF